MVSKETVDFRIGIIVFMIVASLLNLTFGINMLLGLIIAFIVSIISAFIADRPQK